jgi:hypothetical protein
MLQIENCITLMRHAYLVLQKSLKVNFKIFSKLKNPPNDGFSA